MDISRLEPVPLREVWLNEEKDFTPWLERNIDVLADALQIESLSIVERESRTGSFEVDILAEDSTSEKVIIENQFGKSDHDHLGKILTYLTGFEAKTAIWICEDPHPEHVKAVNWLNETTPEDVSFYLVRLEAFKIGESPPAPHFSIIASPSPVLKDIKGTVKELAERHVKRRQFWTELLDKIKGKNIELFANIKPGKENWIQTGSGKSGVTYNYVILMHSARLDLYIDTGKRDDNKRIFDQLFSQKDKIEAAFGEKLDWQRLDDKRASRISAHVNKRVGLRNEDKWDKLQEDMIEAMTRFEKALREPIASIR